MKMRGHYCKVCGEYKANEKFSGRGHAAHICKACAALPPEKQAEEMALTGSSIFRGDYPRHSLHG